MKRTTVYLTDSEVEGLRRLSSATGRSQSDLIREGIGRVLGRTPKRTFHSMGKGRGPGGKTPRWDAEEVYQKTFGRTR